VPVDLVGIADLLVAEQFAASPEITLGAGARFHQDVLVVVPDLVAKVSEHGPVRFAQTDPQLLPVGVQGLHHVDGDHPVGVPDEHLLTGGVARQEIERQSALGTTPWLDRQIQIGQLVDQSAQGGHGRGQLLPGQGVVGGRLVPDQ